MIESFYKLPFPTIPLDDEYVLREQQMSDSENFYHYYSQPAVAQYILAKIPSSLLEAESEVYYCRNLFRLQRGIYWTIAKRNDNQMIGALGLYINNYHHRAELSYDLDPDYWNKGIMTKAVKAISECAFEDIGLQRVEALIMRDNVASEKLLKKSGFTHEGTLRDYKFFEGRHYDVELYSLTEENDKA